MTFETPTGPQGAFTPTISGGLQLNAPERVEVAPGAVAWIAVINECACERRALLVFPIEKVICIESQH